MSMANDRVKKSKSPEFVPAGDGQDGELMAFINSLIDQNAELAGKLESIDSLMELAEKTVIEAGKAAEEIRAEAESEASARSAAIVARAVEKAKAAAQKVVASAKEKAEAEARRIIAEANQKAEQQAQEITKAAEEEGSRIIAEAREKAEEEALFIKREADKKESPASYDDTVELALPPPVALDRILQLHKHLKKDSRVKVVDLKGSLDKGVRIKLLVQAHTPLLSMLAALPEVKDVSDGLVEAGKTSSAHRKGNGACPRTVAVTMKK